MDNGSGSTAVLEVHRLLSKCSLEATILFVLFDLEEDVNTTIIYIFNIWIWFWTMSQDHTVITPLD